MKQILVDLVKLKNLYTGLGQVSYHFGKNLVSAGAENFEFTFLLPENYRGFAGNKVIYKSPSFLMRYLPSPGPYDLWHSIHQDSPYLPSVSIPFLLTIHDLNFLREKSPSKVRKRLKNLQAKINRADMITFISSFTENEVKKHLNISKPTRVIYNGVDIPDLIPVKPGFMEKVKHPFFFSLGVVLPKKNFHVLVDLMKQIEDFSLVIAGDLSGPYAAEILKNIEELGLNDRVILPGIVSEAEKKWLYENCRAFFFPSVNEGFGLPVIEAFSFGKPVFLSTFTSLPEIGSDLAAYWENFNPDYMKKVLFDSLSKEKNLDYAAKRKKRAAGFSWEKNINGYLEIYRMLTG